jgi:mannose-6-phosphate isomerase-like protein (cupin superfamily)
MTVQDHQSQNPIQDQGPDALVFDLAGTPLLASGRTDTLVAASDNLVARVKVYASGGENTTHAHPEEDHLFLVLAGRAAFHLGRDGTRVTEVGPNAGVLVPAGAFYRFASIGPDNLVLMRVGRGHRGGSERIGADGAPLSGQSSENRHQPGVPVPGAVFGTGSHDPG